jgi:hypothetical protein
MMMALAPAVMPIVAVVRGRGIRPLSGRDGWRSFWCGLRRAGLLGLCRQDQSGCNCE